MRFNFRKIASSAASIAMIGSTVALAAAASYPAPYVDGGAADVVVVYGSSQDLSTVTDITTALNSELVDQGGGDDSGSTGVDDDADFVQLRKSSDDLNLGNAWTVVGTNLDDSDLDELLADGTYTSGDNEDYDYTQKIKLGANTLTHFADTSYEDKAPTIGFQLAANTFLLNYTLEFTTNPDSDIVSGDLDDIESSTLHLLGRDYFVLDADNSTLDLTLLDSAVSASLSEGETVTLSAGGNTYDVNIAFVDSTSVKLSINGEVTDSLAERETMTLADGSKVGITEILFQNFAGGSSLVEFSIGSGELLLDNAGNVELNDDDVKGVKAYIERGTPSGGKEEIDSIVIEWYNNKEAFLTPDSDLVLPGFENLKFSMNDFVTPFMEEISVDPAGDTELVLTVPILDGEAEIPLLYSNDSGEFIGLGEDADNLLVTSNSSTLTFNATRGDSWFVASWSSASEGESYLLQIDEGDTEEDDAVNRTQIYNVVTGDFACGENKEETDSCEMGNVDFTITTIRAYDDDESVVLTAQSGTVFHQLYTAEGLRIDLPYVSLDAEGTNTTAGDLTNGAITFSSSLVTSSAGHNADSFYLFFDEEDKDDNVGAGVEFNMTLGDTGDGKLEVSDIDSGQTEHEIGDTNEWETYVVSDLATKMTVDKEPDEDTAKVFYWGSEAYAEVFVSSVGTGDGVSSEGSTSALGSVSVMDTEWDASNMNTKNAIVVGGSCVNSVAASLLGVSANTCGSAWTTATGAGAGSWIIEVFEHPLSTDKVATLVAGWEATDTANAATAFRTQDIDITAGNKYTGTTGTSATMV